MTDKIKAHRFATDNRRLIESSTVCGCFYCKEIYPASEVTRYLSEGSGTAFCPKCGIDSVLPDKSGLPITEEFLSSMHEEWFEKTYSHAPDIYLIKLPAGHGRLATMARPIPDTLTEDMRALAGIGFKTLISALTDPEIQELGLTALGPVCHANGIALMRYPIPDRQIPDSVREIAKFSKSIADKIKAGEYVIVHCRAGIGRSSLIAACVMVHLSISPAEAFSLISQARGLIVPDTPEQHEFVAKVAAYIANFA